MNEAYYEIMVAKKKSPILKAAQIVTALMTGFFALTMFMGMIWGIVVAAAFGVACYFITLHNTVEFEYLYVDKELQIDRILRSVSEKYRQKWLLQN